MVNISEISKKTADELAFTNEEREQLIASRNTPIVFDEDCPETTPERALKFKRVNPVREKTAANNMIQSRVGHQCVRPLFICGKRGKNV